MTQEEAERSARREFGNVTRIEGRSREVWQWPTLEKHLGRCAICIAAIRQESGFTGVALLTLALGIGANFFNRIFTLLNCGGAAQIAACAPS